MVLVNKARRWIKFPTTIHQTNEIKSGFYNKAGIRNIIGIVDGSHINIKAPSENEPWYVNRKQKHSINVQVICDNEYTITDLVAKWPGSTHDSFIFRNSEICRKFETGVFGNSILLGTASWFTL
jgi:hypothetical protein